MINVIYSLDEENNDLLVSESLKKVNKSEVKHIFYKENCSEIMDELNQNSLFCDDNYFIIHNCSFLSHKPSKDEITLMDNLLLFKKNIFLVVRSNKLSIDKNVQLFLKKCKIIKAKKFNDADKKDFIIKIIQENKININDDALNEIISLLPADKNIIFNEINKIKLIDRQLVTKEDIQTLIADYNNNNIFDILISFLKKDFTSLNKILNKVLSEKHDPIEIIQIMSVQLFNIKLMKWALENNRRSSIELSNLGISLFQFNIYKELIYNLNYKKINTLLIKMYDFDVKIKSGLVNPNIALKLLLMEE